MTESENINPIYNNNVEERIIFCDKDFAVINKIPGEVCSFEESLDSSEEIKNQSYIPYVFKSEINRILGYKPAIIECVNRIDKPVSGLVVLALTEKMNSVLGNMLKNHKIKKKYYAIVEGCFKEFPREKEACLLKNEIYFNKKKRQSFITDKNRAIQGKNAELLYRVIGCGERYSFLEIELITGRTHQIRCQLSYNKMPIKGDLKYGAKRSEKIGGIRLHAGELYFYHPSTNEKMIFKADFPLTDNLWKAVEDSIIIYNGDI